jgi:hypothetical protein
LLALSPLPPTKQVGSRGSSRSMSLIRGQDLDVQRHIWNKQANVGLASLAAKDSSRSIGAETSSEYLVMGKSLTESSSIMGISYHTLYEDQQFLKEQARETMRSHIADLPLNIKQATDGLNKLISMLYNIAAPSSSISSDISRDLKKNSDHVRVMAMSLIKDCVKERIEILTSQAAVTHALDFVEKTKQQIKGQFNQDMQQAVE